MATSSRKTALTALSEVTENEGYSNIVIDKAMMNSEIGFCRKVLQVFEENNVSIEHMPSGIDTMTIFVHKDVFEEKEQKEKVNPYGREQ